MNQGRDAHFEPARNHILASPSEDLLRANRDFREAVSGGRLRKSSILPVRTSSAAYPPPAIEELRSNKDIDALCALVHLGQANAVMQVVFDPTGGGPQIGLVVSGISPIGWKALRMQLGEAQLRRWLFNALPRPVT